jgi:hypothetical protein
MKLEYFVDIFPIFNELHLKLQGEYFSTAGTYPGFVKIMPITASTTTN